MRKVWPNFNLKRSLAGSGFTQLYKSVAGFKPNADMGAMRNRDKVLKKLRKNSEHTMYCAAVVNRAVFSKELARRLPVRNGLQHHFSFG